MSKGTMTMGAIAALAAGGYFAYDYYDSRKAKSAESAQSRSGSRPGSAGSGSGSEVGSGSEAGGDGEGSEQQAKHRVKRIEVPRVIGMTPDQARDKLVALGFKADVLELPPDLGCSYEDEQRDIVAVGTICNQEREPGEILMSNAKLRVVIEHDTWEHGGLKADREWHRMPDLSGMPLDQAQSLLRSKGFSDDEFAIVEARTSCGASVVCDHSPNKDARKYASEQGELQVSK